MRTTRHTLAAEGHRGGIDVRVSLRSDAGSGEQAFDGAWFPRSRDLAVELPELVAALDKRGLRIERFTYPLDAWSPAPRKVVVGGRVVRTGGFRSSRPVRPTTGRSEQGPPFLHASQAPRGALKGGRSGLSLPAANRLDGR